jgi:hypothetical protein
MALRAVACADGQGHYHVNQRDLEKAASYANSKPELCRTKGRRQRASFEDVRSRMCLTAPQVRPIVPAAGAGLQQ